MNKSNYLSIMALVVFLFLKCPDGTANSEICSDDILQKFVLPMSTHKMIGSIVDMLKTLSNNPPLDENFLTSTSLFIDEGTEIYPWKLAQRIKEGIPRSSVISLYSNLQGQTKTPASETGQKVRQALTTNKKEKISEEFYKKTRQLMLNFSNLSWQLRDIRQTSIEHLKLLETPLKAEDQAAATDREWCKSIAMENTGFNEWLPQPANKHSFIEPQPKSIAVLAAKKGILVCSDEIMKTCNALIEIAETACVGGLPETAFEEYPPS